MHLSSLFQGARRPGAAPKGRLGRKRKVLGQSDLQLPLPFDGPIAVLNTAFHPEARTREFATLDPQGLQDFAPQALVFPLDTALALADQKLRGLLALPSLELALVLTRVDGIPLAASHRDLLWRAFAVPVFEQLQDAEGQVIARECEVHDGLHLDAGVVLPPELTSQIVNDHCECGGETPRLKRIGPGRERAEVAAAATA